jgi:hypothetical protein
LEVWVEQRFRNPSEANIEIHESNGSIHRLQCMAACRDEIWEADDFTPEVNAERCLLFNHARGCPRCGSWAPPNIVMFGDGGWMPYPTART